MASEAEDERVRGDGFRRTARPWCSLRPIVAQSSMNAAMGSDAVALEAEGFK